MTKFKSNRTPTHPFRAALSCVFPVLLIIASSVHAIESPAVAQQATQGYTDNPGSVESQQNQDVLIDPLMTDDGREGIRNPTAEIQSIQLDRNEASALYRQLTDQEKYFEALDAAEVAVELTEDVFSSFDPALAPVLTDLGHAYLKTGKPMEAKAVFERSIRISEENDGIFNSLLVRSLYGLGMANQQTGAHEEAINNFQRSQHVSHRNYGVVNLEQVEVIEDNVNSFIALDRWKEAENLQLSILKIYQRRYGEDDMRSLPGVHKLARWYHDIKDYRQARVLYRNSIKIKAEVYDEDSVEMLPELTGIATAYLEENGADAIKGLRTQRKIVSIMEENSDEVSYRDRIIAHLEMGDWYVMYNETEDARRLYREAWTLAREDAENLPYWTDYFSQTLSIYPGPPLSIDMIGYGYVGKEVYYDFRFTISREGKPKDVEIIGTNLHSMNRIAATTAFRFARFRPRLVDGEMTETPNISVRRIFPTDPPDDYGVNLMNSQAR